MAPTELVKKLSVAYQHVSPSSGNSSNVQKFQHVGLALFTASFCTYSIYDMFKTYSIDDSQYAPCNLTPGSHSPTKTSASGTQPAAARPR
jgi:hypothetical protein